MATNINAAERKPPSLRRRLARTVLQMLPEQNELLYQFCKSYIDRYKGNNNSNFYTNGEYDFMKKQLEYCMTVFDIGANVGEWAKAALSINPSIQLHCFEPSAATYARLQSRDFPANVRLNRLGLSSSPGELVLHIVDDGSGLNSIYKRYGAFEENSTQTERIPVDTLDNYCSAHSIQQIDFMKVDVEGHELEVFKGMPRLLNESRVGIIQFEYGGCNIDARVFLKDIWGYFTKCPQYSFYKIFPKRIRKVAQYSQQLEDFQYQNWLIVLDSVESKWK